VGDLADNGMSGRLGADRLPLGHDLRVRHAPRSFLTGGAVACLLLFTATGCSGDQHPNADPAGLFPHEYSERGFMDPGSTLLLATAATATTRTYTFDADVPEQEAWSLVANCTSGQITALSAGGPCKGEPGEWSACAPAVTSTSRSR
jgi:hypothetical protein